MIEQKILDRIKKCLALGDSPSPHEAAVAMEMAQKLMAKHGVTMTSLEDTSSEVEQSKGVRSTASCQRVKSWELSLFNSIATTFGCRIIFNPGMPQGIQRRRGLPTSAIFATFVFIGVEEDNQLAVYVSSILLKQLAKARSKFTRGLLAYDLPRKRKTQEIDSYCHGWVDGASEKVRPMAEVRMAAAREADGKTGSNTAMIVLSDEKKREIALADYMSQFTGKAKTNNRGGGSSSARSQGIEDGLKASVNHAIGGQHASKRGLR